MEVWKQVTTLNCLLVQPAATQIETSYKKHLQTHLCFYNGF